MYKLDTLPNGLKLITVPMRGTHTATVLVITGTGSKYETKKNNGISHFLEHMFFKGTKKRPSALVIASELDSMGSIYNAFTAKEYTGYWIKARANKIEQAMDMVSDLLLNSKYALSEINREKGVIIEEINMYLDNPIMHIEDVFEQCLYNDQPAGWDTIGTKENVLKFKRKDFINYFNQQYGAQNTIICLAGNVDNKTGLKLVNKYFSQFRQSDFKDKSPVKEKQVKPEIKLEYKKTDQAHLSLGVRTFPSKHKDKYTAKILAAILGGSMSSRLFIDLRERKGLAYYIKTSTEFYTDSGYLTTQAGVPVDKVEQAIKIILAGYMKLKSQLVKQKELEKIKDMIQGKTVIYLESSDNMASWYARRVIMKERIIRPKSYFKILKSVRSSDIRRVAQEVFQNNKLNLAIIGPFKDKKKFKGLLKI